MHALKIDCKSLIQSTDDILRREISRQFDNGLVSVAYLIPLPAVGAITKCFIGRRFTRKVLAAYGVEDRMILDRLRKKFNSKKDVCMEIFHSGSKPFKGLICTYASNCASGFKDMRDMQCRIMDAAKEEAQTYHIDKIIPLIIEELMYVQSTIFEDDTLIFV